MHLLLKFLSLEYQGWRIESAKSRWRHQHQLFDLRRMENREPRGDPRTHRMAHELAGFTNQNVDEFSKQSGDARNGIHTIDD